MSHSPLPALDTDHSLLSTAISEFWPILSSFLGVPHEEEKKEASIYKGSELKTDGDRCKSPLFISVIRTSSRIGDRFKRCVRITYFKNRTSLYLRQTDLLQHLKLGNLSHEIKELSFHQRINYPIPIRCSQCGQYIFPISSHINDNLTSGDVKNTQSSGYPIVVTKHTWGAWLTGYTL